MKIWFEKMPVAELIPEPAGLSLAYDESWIGRKGAFPVSTAMPVDQVVYGPEKVTPWVVNLLPESRQLEVISRSALAKRGAGLRVQSRINAPYRARDLQ